MGILDGLLTGPEVGTGDIDKIFKDAGKIGSGLKPININAGGLKSSIKNGVLRVGASAGRRGLVGSLASSFPEQAAQIAALRAKVAPGISDLRAARLAEIENARMSAVGNLKENLQRRRVLGSSFAGDAMNRAELEFGQAKDKVAAETFLQELDLTHQLTNEEFDLRRKEFTTKLDELNLRADLAKSLSADATDILKASAEIQAQLAMAEAQAKTQTSIAQAELDAQAQAGAGSLFGTLFGLGTGGGSTIGGSLFNAAKTALV